MSRNWLWILVAESEQVGITKGLLLIPATEEKKLVDLHQAALIATTIEHNTRYHRELVEDQWIRLSDAALARILIAEEEKHRQIETDLQVPINALKGKIESAEK